MKRTILSLLFALFAVAAFSQNDSPSIYVPGHAIVADSGVVYSIRSTDKVQISNPNRDPTVLVSYTIKRNWGGYISGAVAFQTNCFQVATDQNPIPITCLMDRVVGELTKQGKLKGANLDKPYRDYVEITGWMFLNRDIVLSTRDSRWNAPVKE